MKVIIILEKYGGFCNRLFQSLHYHAYAMDKGIKFCNPTILGLLKFDNNFFYFFDQVYNFFLKIINKSLKCISRNKEICLYLNKDNFIRIVEGWDFREYSLVNKFYKELNLIYSFDRKTLSNKSKYFLNYIENLKLKGKYIVAVHLRRKDYKLWNNGKFYYNDEFYVKVTHELKTKLIEENFDPFIVALSDDNIPQSTIFDYVSDGSWKEDQIILQNCNLIIGPPSTFTMWASYLAKVPMINLNSEYIYDLNNRKICKG